jgi:hypothetical protein
MTEPTISKHATSAPSLVKLTHGAMAINFIIEPFKPGLIPNLSMFGYNLFYGYLRRDIFLHNITRYQLDINNQLVDAILATQDPNFANLDPTKKESIQKTLDLHLEEVAFARYLTELALVENWKFPSLINRNSAGGLQQITGKTRAFATVMTRADPWTHYPVLVLDRNINDINEILENPIHCHNDKILNQVFGKTLTENTWEQELVIDINVVYDNGSISCNMTNLHNGKYYDKYQKQGQDLLDSHVAWRKKVGACPTLYIHTDHPENINNFPEHWATKIVPLNIDQDFRRECVRRPAWLEKLAQEYHKNPTHESDAFVLWVLDDRQIDLRDFAWWGDNDTNVMIDSDWKFIMYQPSAAYCYKFIKVSQAK